MNFKRFFALFVCVCMLLGVTVVPVHAEESGGIAGAVQSFFEWTVNASNAIENGFWRAIYGDSWNSELENGGQELTSESVSDRYNEYTGNIRDSVGTVVTRDGTSRLYFDFPSEPFSFSSSRNSFDYLYHYGGVSPEFYGVTSGHQYYDILSWTLVANTGSVVFPFDCKFTYAYDGVIHGAGIFDPHDYYTNGTVHSGSRGATLGNPYIKVKYEGTFSDASECGARVQPYVDIYPASGSLEDVATEDISAASRVGFVSGDVYTVNENGEKTEFYDYSVYNETTNIYNNPVTGESQPVSDWQYDYVERQYNLICEDGSNVTVKYGDDYISITEDGAEDRVYYGGEGGEGGAGGAGGEGGSGGSGSISDAIAGLFAVLGEILMGIITGIINLATSALGAVEGLFGLFGELVEVIKGFFGGYTSFLSEVFPFLPSETFTILNFGLILMVAAAVFRRFLR